MTPATWAVLSVVVMLAALVQGGTGFGFALIVAPTLGWFAPALVPVCLLLLMLPLNLFVAWREREAFDVRAGGWITLGRVGGTFIGVALVAWLPARETSVLIGVATIAAALLAFMLPVFAPARGSLMTAGLVTGVTETATGIGGPPLAVVYQHQPAAVLRATLAACFVIGELMSLTFLWMAGRTEVGQLQAALLLMPAMLVGAQISRCLHGLMHGRSMRRFVLLFSLASGCGLLLHG